MNIYITLDYELFFGPESGTPDKCILEPTKALEELTAPFGVTFTIFADAGYLMALRRQMDDYPQLKEDLDKIAAQLAVLTQKGHAIGLHVHPHWEDSFYDGSRWVLDTTRYKLADFTQQEVMRIVSTYNDILKELAQVAPTAYRAGGWSAQPFEPIGKALEANGIHTDSSVYPGGWYVSEQQSFDFRKAPAHKTFYNFSRDVALEDPMGKFEEYPISAYRVPPTFFWRLAWTKIMKGKMHRPFGNGQAISLSREGVLAKMTKPSTSVVSIDGYKTSFLHKAFKQYLEMEPDNNGNFVIIGHPKAFTLYSLKKLEEFLEHTHTIHQYKVFK